MHSNAMSQTRGMSRRTVLSIALLVGLTWSACLCSAAEPDRNQNELHVMGRTAGRTAGSRSAK